MVNEGATGAILITSGEFTQAAIEAANRQAHVRLVDGDELRSMLGPDAIPPMAAAPDYGRDFLSAMNGPPSERSPVQVRSYGRGADRASRAWLAFSAFGLLIFVLLIWGLLKRTEGTAGPSETAVPVGTAAAGRDVAVEQVPPPPVLTGNAAAPSGDACTEVIDHFSSTYIDHCATRRPLAQPTAAEIREQQRRANEAAKVIEASTPEM
jgi:hypothetical protein